MSGAVSEVDLARIRMTKLGDALANRVAQHNAKEAKMSNTVAHAKDVDAAALELGVSTEVATRKLKECKGSLATLLKKELAL
jgi:hypothetical protein